MNEVLDKEEIRKDILKVESMIRSIPGSLGEDPFPLTHTFGDGIFIREIRVPKGYVIVTKLFKQTHATFLLQGEVSIVTEEGIKRIKAPYSMITKSGIKRVIYTHEDVIWTCVHANPMNERDIDKIEDFVIAKNYEELGFSDDEKKIIELSKEK